MHIYPYIPPTPLMLESVEADSFLFFFQSALSFTLAYRFRVVMIIHFDSEQTYLWLALVEAKN